MATLGIFDRTGDQELRNTLLGNGRSVASTQLNQGNRAIQNQAFSMAASQRGGNPALAMRNAQNAAAAAGVEHNYNQAKLRASEQAQAQQLAQAEDAKRGQVIGGVLGGIGAGLGSLAGPAGTALGGAAGAALGGAVNSGISGKPVDGNALAQTLGRGAINAGAGAAMAPAAAAAQPGLTIEQKQAAQPGYDGAYVPGMPQAAAQPATPPLQTGMLPPTAAPQAQVSPMTPPPMQQVAVNNAPMPEGAPMEPQSPVGGYVPAAQIAQTMQPQAQPAVAPPPVPFNPQSLPTGPAPVYANQTAPGGFGGMRNGQGGTTPLAQSRDELFNYLGLTMGKGAR